MHIKLITNHNGSATVRNVKKLQFYYPEKLHKADFWPIMSVMIKTH